MKGGKRGQGGEGGEGEGSGGGRWSGWMRAVVAEVCRRESWYGKGMGRGCVGVSRGQGWRGSEAV